MNGLCTACTDRWARRWQRHESDGGHDGSSPQEKMWRGRERNGGKGEGGHVGKEGHGERTPRAAAAKRRTDSGTNDIRVVKRSVRRKAKEGRKKERK